MKEWYRVLATKVEKSVCECVCARKEWQATRMNRARWVKVCEANKLKAKRRKRRRRKGRPSKRIK